MDWDTTAWHQAQRILAIRLDSMGDVLMTTPALRALKEGEPGRHITLMTSRSGAEVAQYVPEVDQVITYSAPWMKATNNRLDSRAERRMIEVLRRGQFDAAVIFTVYSQNPLPAAFMAYLAEIPLRLAHCRENPYQLLSHWVRDLEPATTIRHEVQRQLDLVGSVNFHTTNRHLSFLVRHADRARVASLAAEAGLDLNRPWVVVHPGATAPSRRYPPELFARVIQTLAQRDGFQVALTGTAEESDLLARIHTLDGGHSIPMPVSLSLGEMAALLEIAPLLISNNTGPVHLAAALGTPVVDLYALTNPQHTPWEVPNRVLSHDVPCKFCYKSVCPEGHNNCLRLIHPKQVIAAVHDLWEEQALNAQRNPIGALHAPAQPAPKESASDRVDTKLN